MAHLDDTSGAVDARPSDTPVDAAATVPVGANDQYPDDTRNPQPNPEGEKPEGDAVEGGEPATPAIEAPVSLNAEAKAMFAQLPPEAQRVWADTETARNRQVQEATTKASNATREAQSFAARAEAEAQQRYAQQLQRFAAAYEPQRPNPANYGNDIQSYSRDSAIYEHELAQHRELMQQIGEVGAQANQTLSGFDQQTAQAEAETLRAALPEWFDEAKHPEVKAQLTAIGAELGYTPELMAQAGANDIIALHKASGWKADAEKYRALMKQRMEPVRAAKQVPPSARAVAPGAQAQPASVAAQLYPDDVRR